MRLRSFCSSKIHRATVTHTDVDYIGSIAVDADLLDRAGLLPGEKVAVWNVTNGERFETYALPAPYGEGAVIVNGAAAHRCRPGDKVIIAAFVLTDEPVTPRMIMVDDQNRFAGDLVDNRWPAKLPLDLCEPAMEV
jgi:aspartate 1-decarboxylase